MAHSLTDMTGHVKSFYNSGPRQVATAARPVLVSSGEFDGIHLEVRLEQEERRPLVMMRLRFNGRNELVALSDGCQASTESWADLLRSCRRHGVAALVLAVGDGPRRF